MVLHRAAYSSGAHSVTADKEERHRDLHFDPWLIPAEGSPLAALVEELFATVPLPAITPGRKPRADALERRNACLGALVANLAVFHLSSGAFEIVAIPLRNLVRSRYDRAGFNTDVLREVFTWLCVSGWADSTLAEFRKRRTGALPGELLVTRFAGMGLNRDHVARVPGAETIELWSGPPGRWNKELVEYADNEDTIRMRGEMALLNAALLEADITFAGVPMPPIQMKRVFSEDFQSHGRVYQGWWLNRRRGERHLLRINGEGLADLDFRSMFCALAYWRAGEVQPNADPYALSGFEDPIYRRGVKKVFNSLFFRLTPAHRLPDSVHVLRPGEGLDDIRRIAASSETPVLPVGTNMRKFVEAATEAHPKIAHLFNTQIGFELFKLESDIIIAALLELHVAGEVALPFHDGLMVAQSRKREAIAAMENACRNVLGVSLPVVEKPVEIPLRK